MSALVSESRRLDGRCLRASLGGNTCKSVDRWAEQGGAVEASR